MSRLMDEACLEWAKREPDRLVDASGQRLGLWKTASLVCKERTWQFPAFYAHSRGIGRVNIDSSSMKARLNRDLLRLSSPKFSVQPSQPLFWATRKRIEVLPVCTSVISFPMRIRYYSMNKVECSTKQLRHYKHLANAVVGL